ncbi:MAG: Flp pilus assembly protein CpaB [Anaerolineae bacterium]|nr:Flp pilus assembly protein CpaB [Anaerolineae bacterium]
MGRLRGCLWLTAGLVVALVAGVVGFVVLTRASTQRAGAEQAAAMPEVDVVVASRAIAVRSVLAAEDLQLTKLPVSAVPEGAVSRLEDAVGKITMVDLYAGEVILSQRLLDPNTVTGDGRLALFITEDEVLVAIPANQLLSQVNVLKPGDHVDLLFSLDVPVRTGTQAAGEEKQVTFSLLQNLTIAAIIRSGASAENPQSGTPQALLLTVNPQEALVLKYMIDAGATADVVLRAPGVERPFPVEPVDMDYVIDQYRIPTGPVR